MSFFRIAFSVYTAQSVIDNQVWLSWQSWVPSETLVDWF